MLTEHDNENSKLKTIQNGIRLCEEAILKAEKYERLSENKDWKGYLADLKILATLHENEIKMATTMIVDAPNHTYVKHDEAGHEVVVSSKQDWTDFIARHEIERSQIVNLIKEPDRLLELSKIAQEKLPILKGKAKEISDGSLVTNGVE